MHELEGTQFWKITDQKKLIADFVRNGGFDVLTVLNSVNCADVFFGTNQIIGGHGISERSFLGSGKGVDYATLRTLIYGGSDGAELRYQSDCGREDRPENNSWLPESLSVNESEEARVRSVIIGLYEKLVRAELSKLGM